MDVGIYIFKERKTVSVVESHEMRQRSDIGGCLCIERTCSMRTYRELFSCIPSHSGTNEYSNSKIAFFFFKYLFIYIITFYILECGNNDYNDRQNFALIS